MGLWRRYRNVRDDTGQAVVELAFVVMLLTVLVFGSLEVGRVLNAWLIVTQASREGARTASAECTRDPGCSDAVTERVEAALSGLDAASARWTLTGGPYVSGQPVEVEVEYDIELITPVISAFFPNGPVTVRGGTSMRLE